MGLYLCFYSIHMACATLRKQNSKVSEMNIAKSCFILIVYCILGPCYSYTSYYCVSIFHARNSGLLFVAIYEFINLVKNE